MKPKSSNKVYKHLAFNVSKYVTNSSLNITNRGGIYECNILTKATNDLLHMILL